MFSDVQVKNLNGINYVEAGDPSSAKKIILFHGYGADMFDLHQLAEAIPTQDSYHWIFPNGFLEVPIGPMMTGRAWFQIQFDQMERHLKLGEFQRHTPPGMKEAAKKIEVFLKTICPDFSESFIGGFSQGAMLTMELLVSTDISPRGAIFFSNTLVSSESWKSKAPNKKIRFIQTHGKNDPILPYGLAEELFSMLEQSGWEGEFHSFSGGHEIPMKALSAASKFIDL